jgi:hypothetical protein
VEKDGRDTDHNGTDEASNVVRLPVDWLGPREELVPFGPSAWRADNPVKRESPALSTRGADVLELTPRREPDDPDCTQHDFWGGDLEAIPRPVLRPAEPSRAEAAAPSPSSSRVDPMPTRRVLAGRGSRWGRGYAIAGGAVAVVAATVAVVLPGVRTQHGAPVSRASIFGADIPDLPARLAMHAPKLAHARVTTQVRATRLHVKAHHAGAPRSSVATFVRTSSPIVTQPTQPATGSSTASYHPATTSTRVTSGSGAATAAATRTHKAGPVGPGASFGPGQLG